MDEDMEAALAWQAVDRLKCPGCGRPRDETMRSDAENRYVVEPVACHDCRAKAQAARAFANNNGDADGVYWMSTDREE